LLPLHRLRNRHRRRRWRAGSFGALGFRLGVRFRGFSPSPARAPKFIRQNLLIARAARPGGRPAVGTRQCDRGGIWQQRIWLESGVGCNARHIAQPATCATSTGD
jgi:hypothetical protein